MSSKIVFWSINYITGTVDDVITGYQFTKSTPGTNFIFLSYLVDTREILRKGLHTLYVWRLY